MRASSTNGTNLLATPNTALTATTHNSAPLNSNLLIRTGPTSGLHPPGTGGSVLNWSISATNLTVPSSKWKSHTSLPTETQMLLTPTPTLSHTLALTLTIHLMTLTLRLTVVNSDITGNSQQKLNTAPRITISTSGKTMK